ncbi:TRAP transporter small permease [Pseudohalocynthiibacter aestuariivivens]|jgi:TRAP-type C4-dicarboxylate transport system permease small subunit|uniref:TRAP transporter small permease protein n=1 Tax=Pseudohalocynthiibacter aestuariivivens TaxID=1591409 RepID=A0ABV5JG72_9RHOB|nr:MULTISPECIES: TRAP transporter small permease [Pseudohalocynthiibacter]MBS9716202.1 TRAP transporter small permease [Pseudohalocynthiibacter aestuariivivens]MCK0100990.1 TRAP transporter small permease [Pseudohalocynthiibacter sp. F2068]
MAIAPEMQHKAGRKLEAIARWLAYFGGLTLVSIAVLTVVSITGRKLSGFGFGPIKGDFELVEAGCAIAVFSFLPWCQIKRGHVTVDIFIARLPLRIQAALGFLGDTLLTLVSAIILWRFWLGFGEKFPYGTDTFRTVLGMGSKPFFPETTYELELPVWIPYGLSLIGAIFFLIVCVYTMWRSLNWTLNGQEGSV